MDVATRGPVSGQDQTEAQERVSRAAEAVATPVLSARAVLTIDENPRLERPASAHGELLLQGRPVHARVTAPTMPQAVRELAERLEIQARQYVERMTTLHRRAPEARSGEWQHGAWSPPRQVDVFPRDPAEREVIRRKTYAMEPQTEAEAAVDLEALDHDFYLFADVETGADAVLHRRDDGRLEIIEPPGTPRPANGCPLRATSRFSEPVALEAAISEMNEVPHRFLFFVDAATGRGAVIYLRRDGHYGVIEPA